MKTKLLTSLLAGGLALGATGCGTMNVTTLGSPDHRADPGQLVLLRITFGDETPPVHYAGHLDSERPMPQNEDLLIAGTAY